MGDDVAEFPITTSDSGSLDLAMAALQGGFVKQLLLSFLLTFSLAVVITAALADGDIHVEHPWSRATIGSSDIGVIYLTLSNQGDEVDRLISVSTPIAEHASVHETVEQNGMIGMQPAGVVEIQPGGQKILEPGQPGGLHIMLMGLKKAILEGDTFPLILAFEKTGSVEIEVVAVGLIQ